MSLVENYFAFISFQGEARQVDSILFPFWAQEPVSILSLLPRCLFILAW